MTYELPRTNPWARSVSPRGGHCPSQDAATTMGQHVQYLPFPLTPCLDGFAGLPKDGRARQRFKSKG